MAAEAEAGEAVAPKKSRKLMIIGAAAVVVLLAGAGLYMFLSAGSASASAEGHGETAHAEAAAPSFIFNLPPMTVNLNSEGEAAPAFMKLSVALEVASEAVMVEIQPRMAKVVDAFQVYLRELRRSDLEGSAGIYRLKEELLRRVNVAIYPAQVDSVLFKEILVQ
ncbi:MULTISPECIES: flagellar basal body-associated FliL family protein [unclassified Devosia]|uniref:flagellar basal body-associated FliL family protein n=1 Tax=unclassified Devosia TaxID=196773 RepID=UPI001557962E|nr:MULTISPECIES: flagellar basal body-associated FliL family protein [unclassified Devosia]